MQPLTLMFQHSVVIPTLPLGLAQQEEENKSLQSDAFEHPTKTNLVVKPGSSLHQCTTENKTIKNYH